MLERLTGIDVKKDIPSKDPDVISLFSSTKALNIKPEDIGGEKTGTYGIPEFGTDFVRRMLVVANPKSFLWFNFNFRFISRNRCLDRKCWDFDF
ncbi:hypothetical protein [Mycoplasmopsis cynos]|uniref:hypothetical protein n=1 Tax=Mycoplasmopsis cynos TaxID=171284 RepID=UPI0021FEB2F4|nr:hypothetical protein [Mycoplasmopsis cynos]UWV92751.1 hypothetical protein NWE57_01515 [Mycoplasmopsis cynos]